MKKPITERNQRKGKTKASNKYNVNTKIAYTKRKL